MKKILLSSFIFFMFQGFSESNESQCEAVRKIYKEKLAKAKQSADKAIAELKKDIKLFKDGIESYKEKLELAKAKHCSREPAQNDECGTRENPCVTPLPIGRPTCEENPNQPACQDDPNPPEPNTLTNTDDDPPYADGALVCTDENTSGACVYKRRLRSSEIGPSAPMLERDVVGSQEGVR